MKQITEDYCSFEVAKLLKEKGFDIPCRQAYFNGSLVDYTMYGFCDGELIDCPSQSLALKWLREVHGLHIEIGYIKNHYGNLNCGYFFSIVGINSDYKYCQSCLDDIFEEPEQAVEAALKYTLENLI